MEVFDFSGFATKNNLKCSDGRVIRKDAFKNNDGKTVPLVWQHQHDGPENVLGHAVLENREDGVYAYGKFNSSEAGKNAKLLVEHGDITALSIFANQLKQRGNDVLHGAIKELSLVMSGANPGALIDNLSIQHGDVIEMSESEAIIYTGEEIPRDEDGLPITYELAHAEEEESGEESSSDDETLEDVFNTLNEKQKTAVYAIIGAAIEEGEMEQADEDGEVLEHQDNEGGTVMKHNAFDDQTAVDTKKRLTKDQMSEILADAKKCGSLKESFLAHAEDYGLDPIDVLFPDARLVTNPPEMISRRMEWVSGVISGTHHTPFSRIKSTAADITADEARAKGYVKATLKKEEVIKLLKRTTTPTTIYKKQKLDRDDIIDIVDLDVVSWLKAEMRVMLDEEIARAILIGDGREADDPDKINEENIRPIYTDDDMYSHHIKLDADVTTDEMVEAFIRGRKYYKGSGNPTMYTTTDVLTDMLLSKDSIGRRLYNTQAELESALRVAKIVEVEVMEGAQRTVDTETLLLQAIFVNLRDYTVGADKGGEVSMFDDFDIDYNQYKYLIEARISGALTKPKSALVFEKVKAGG